MNCHPLCDYINANVYKDLKRPHLTCLTCFMRRYYYGKLNKNHFVVTKNAMFFGSHATESYPGRRIMFVAQTDRPAGFVIPKWQDTYFILIYNGNKYQTMWHLKNAIVKNLLTIAEFFAQI